MFVIFHPQANTKKWLPLLTLLDHCGQARHTISDEHVHISGLLSGRTSPEPMPLAPIFIQTLSLFTKACITHKYLASTTAHLLCLFCTLITALSAVGTWEVMLSDLSSACKAITECSITLSCLIPNHLSITFLMRKVTIFKSLSYWKTA